MEKRYNASLVKSQGAGTIAPRELGTIDPVVASRWSLPALTVGAHELKPQDARPKHVRTLSLSREKTRPVTVKTGASYTPYRSCTPLVQAGMNSPSRIVPRFPANILWR